MADALRASVTGAALTGPEVAMTCPSVLRLPAAIDISDRSVPVAGWQQFTSSEPEQVRAASVWRAERVDSKTVSEYEIMQVDNARGYCGRACAL